MGKLETFIKHKPEYLSGGQQQRLSILRAMAIKPRLLLMDEPFSALDPEMKISLIESLKLLWTELGTTVLIVSHNPQELLGLAEPELYIKSEQ
jgi:molybdate transport system ATP-binding protein